MKLKIQNFRGIQSADIDMRGVTIVAGKNATGKTSIIQALIACLTGYPAPIDGLKSTHAGRLLRNGTQGGEIALITDIGTASIKYPAGKLITTGTPPSISAHAAGLESLLDIPKKDRSKIIQDILQTEPMRAELYAELCNIGAGGEVTIESIWSAITAQGWDAAHQHAKEKGARLKGQWEEITHENYGSQKAESWLPAAWTGELWNTTEDALAAIVSHEKEWLQAATSASAVSSAELTRLKTTIETSHAAQMEYDAEAMTYNAMKANRDTIQAALAALPGVEEQMHVCPACKTPLAIESGKIINRIPISPAIKMERKTKIDECKSSIAALDKAIIVSGKKLSDLTAKTCLGGPAQRDYDRLLNLPPSTDTKPTEECRARVRAAEDRLAAFTAKTRADILHKTISLNADMIQILSPTGLRQNKLLVKMVDFNADLQRVSVMATWSTVSIDNDLGINFGDMPYALCSESEKYRCRCTLQAAIARVQNAPILIFDGADILDKQGLNCLAKIALAGNVEAVIGLTLSKIDDVPDMKTHGIAYWVSDGLIERISNDAR